VLAGAAVLLVWAAASAVGKELAPYTIIGDAIPASLTGNSGDPLRGRAIVLDRRLGACLLCHTGPFPEEKFQSTLAPDLSGAGSRWSIGQLRLRLVDATRLNPDTIMPPYYRVDGLTRVGTSWQGKPILTAEQIEDVVAFLSILTERP
jgi:L-cysteine S-thiosulfotransferase